MKAEAMIVALLLTTSLIGAEEVKSADLSMRPARPAPEWVAGGVMYQMYLRAFTPEGTLKAAEARLPRLAELGVTALYLCPVFVADDDPDPAYWSPRQKKSGLNNPRNPYRMKDFYHVDPEYGTDADLKSFVAAAHGLKLRVMLDMVFLHCGPKAVFIEQHPDFVKRDKGGKIVLMAWNFPGLNYASPELREYLWKNMEMWVKDFGVDGFRCDVSDGVPLDFWETGRERLEKIRPDIGLLAEGQRVTNQLKAFDCCYGFDWYSKAIEPVMDGKRPVSDLPAAWKKMAAERPKSARFIRYFDNHDISNDDDDKRREARWGSAACEALLALCFTLDGVPFLYNGQEVADTAKHSIYGKLAVNWANGDTAAGKARFAFCQKACALRKAEKALTQGDMAWLDNDAPSVVVSFARALGSERIVSVINLTDKAVNVKVAGDGVFKPLLAARADGNVPEGFKLGAYGYWVGKR